MFHFCWYKSETSSKTIDVDGYFFCLQQRDYTINPALSVTDILLGTICKEYQTKVVVMFSFWVIYFVHYFLHLNIDEVRKHTSSLNVGVEKPHKNSFSTWTKAHLPHVTVATHLYSLSDEGLPKLGWCIWPTWLDCHSLHNISVQVNQQNTVRIIYHAWPVPLLLSLRWLCNTKLSKANHRDLSVFWITHYLQITG